MHEKTARRIESRRIRRPVPMHLMFKPTPCSMDVLVYTTEEVAYWNETIHHIVTEAMSTGKVIYEHV